MVPIVLIAANFVRTQWLVVAIMTAYLLGISGVFAVHQQPGETTFFLQWHSFYVLFLAMILAVGALQSERKSRRIIAVLSKGIHRWQYLAGLLCGCGAIAGLFWIVIGCAMLAFPHQTASSATLVAVFVALFCCSLATAAVALFYSVFLHPLLATFAASATLALPYLMQPGSSPGQSVWFPVSGIFVVLQEYQIRRTSEVWGVAVAAIAYSLFFLVAAAVLFSRRDVTTSPE
jgi:ABC-type transport system involved in multi-copper enzyme maturation permease subunit